LTDGRGVPLSLVVAGANRHDSKLLAATLDQVVVSRPLAGVQHLCMDAGYKGGAVLQAVHARGYLPHLRQRKEEIVAKRMPTGFKARRWVVERTHSWLNRSRKLLVSFEKSEASYRALLSLAAALICWQQTITI
jgi:putative transposase